MTVWRKTDSRTKLGVAIYNFHADGQHQLPLDIGDIVYILEETTDWFRGYAAKDKANKGIFPRSYIHVKEATVQITGAIETVASTEPPLVQELTSVLKEWHTIWKQLFVDRSSEVDKVKKMILDLIDWRSKLLTRKYTVDEQKTIQQQVTNLIDSGNALLSLDLVVRDDLGNVLDPTKHSTVEIYKRHVDAAENIRKRSSLHESETDTARPSWPSSFNLYVMLRNFVCKIGEDADILMNIYDAKEQRFISENYLVKWSKQGVPMNIEMLNNFRVVFTDLGSKDRMRERVFLVFQIVRIGVMDPKNVDNKKQTQGIRRPFGVAAMDISELMQGMKDSKEDDQHFIPFQQCGQTEFIESVIKKVIGAKEINHKGQGLWVSLKVLLGDLRQVQEEQIHLVLPGTAVARKMGFPEVIMPGDVRNDIYLTLRYGEFNKGVKTTDKNVEVLIHVCDKNGDIMKDVISYGCGDSMMSEYKSMVYYHEDKPRWFETVKIAISTEVEFTGLHLRFTFRHKASNEAKDRTEKPFAMSFVPLMNSNGTTIEDSVHELLVYKMEITKKHDDAKAYLRLPPTKQALEKMGGSPASKQPNITSGPFTLSARDSLVISTYVCSTKLTHNVDLLGLLKWHEVLNDTKRLERHLSHLMKEEGEEIVKFLQDLLDSLFNILLQNNNSELCDDLVFDALVYIIALISDRKYHQFRPVLDAYIQTTFSFSMAYTKLIHILKDYVDNANDKSKHDMLLRAVKSLEYIFKFIIRSRVLFAMINEGRGKQQFEISLKQLLTSFTNMMLYQTEHTVLVQGAALKFISSIIGDVMTVFDPVELSHVMVEFVGNVAKDRLIKTKMTCIDQIIQTELFKLPECRRILLPAFLQHTRELMEGREEMEICVNVLSHIMDQLWSPDIGPTDADITVIMKSTLRTVIQSVIGMDRSSKLVQFFGHQPPPSMSVRSPQNENCVAVMVAVLRQMSEAHYQEYINGFPTPFDLLDFLMEILMVFQDLVGRNVYPSDWLEMIMLQNSVILRALRFFATTIHSKFSNPFEYQLWNNFFHCAISFLTQNPLQLNNFTATKRNKIIARYKDMRRETAFEIRSMWFNLGTNKIKFIPELVGPFLEMTLIPDTELRRATIPIFFDMMQCEYMQPVPNSNRIQGNFHEVENEMITQLDMLVEGGRGDEQYRDLMFETLMHLCDTKEQPGLREQGKAFVEMIWKLLERLLVYRHIIQDEIKEHRMSCIVNLLDFYHDINRQEMYIRYLHKLSDLHLGCDNYTEAAYTMMLYAVLLQWSDEPLPPMLHYGKYPEAQTHRDLKERLYYEIISYFEKGKMWEKGIELCEELAQQYKEEVFDYSNLSKILKRQAELYDCILKQMRPEPEYFRVGYFGQGFPSFLQNKVFIYRGKEYERLADFCARMQILFPYAELMRTLDQPGEEICSSEKQYLQINAVTPVLQLKPHFEDKPISEQILKYYRVNEVQVFTYSRRADDGGGDVTKMWLERTNMTTSYPLPGIVGWYSVVAAETMKVSPIETAIETMEDKNKKLAIAIEQLRHDPSFRVDNLAMLLNGVVDAAVGGGIANYKDFYLGKDYEPEDQERLRTLTVDQMTLVREGLILHKQRVTDQMMPFHKHMEEKFAGLCNKIEEEYGIKVADKGVISGSATLRRNQSMPGSTVNRRSDGSISGFSIASETTNYNTAPRPSQQTRSQSVFMKEPRGATPPSSKSSSKVSLSNLKKRVSQVTEHFTGDASSRNSWELVELNEQLTPRRPPRPDSERRPSRPGSSISLQSGSKASSSNSLASSDGTVTSNRMSDASETDANMEEPPPLPEKQTYADYTNTPDQPPPVPRRPSTTPSHRTKLTPAGDLDPDLDSQAPPLLPDRVRALAGGGGRDLKTEVTSGTQSLRGKKKQNLTRPRRMTMTGNVEFVPGLGNTPRAQPPPVERSLSDVQINDIHIPGLPKRMTIIGPSAEDETDPQELSESSARGIDPHEPLHSQVLMKSNASCDLSKETLSSKITPTQAEAKTSAGVSQFTGAAGEDSSAVSDNLVSPSVGTSETVTRPRQLIVSHVPNIPLDMLIEQAESIPVHLRAPGADDGSFNTRGHAVGVESKQSSQMSSYKGGVPGPPIKMLTEDLVAGNDLPEGNTEVSASFSKSDKPPPLPPRMSMAVPRRDPETRENAVGPSLDLQKVSEGSEVQQQVLHLLTRMSCLGLVKQDTEAEDCDLQVSQLLSRMSQLGIQDPVAQDTSLPSRERLKRISQLVFQSLPGALDNLPVEANNLPGETVNTSEQGADTKKKDAQKKTWCDQVADSKKNKDSEVPPGFPQELAAPSEKVVPKVPPPQKELPISDTKEDFPTSKTDHEEKSVGTHPLPQDQPDLPARLPLDKSSCFDDLSMETSSQELPCSKTDVQGCCAWVSFSDSCGQESLAEMQLLDVIQDFPSSGDDGDDDDYFDINPKIPETAVRKTGSEVLKQEEAEEVSSTKRQSVEVFNELLQMRQKHLVSHRLSGFLSDQASSSHHSSCETLGSNSDLTETKKNPKCGQHRVKDQRQQKVEGQSSDSTSPSSSLTSSKSQRESKAAQKPGKRKIQRRSREVHVPVTVRSQQEGKEFQVPVRRQSQQTEDKFLKRSSQQESQELQMPQASDGSHSVADVSVGTSAFSDMNHRNFDDVAYDRPMSLGFQLSNASPEHFPNSPTTTDIVHLDVKRLLDKVYQSLEDRADSDQATRDISCSVGLPLALELALEALLREKSLQSWSISDTQEDAVVILRLISSEGTGLPQGLFRSEMLGDYSLCPPLILAEGIENKERNAVEGSFEDLLYWYSSESDGADNEEEELVSAESLDWFEEPLNLSQEGGGKLGVSETGTLESTLAQAGPQAGQPGPTLTQESLSTSQPGPVSTQGSLVLSPKQAGSNLGEHRDSAPTKAAFHSEGSAIASEPQADQNTTKETGYSERTQQFLSKSQYAGHFRSGPSESVSAENQAKAAVHRPAHKHNPQKRFSTSDLPSTTVFTETASSSDVEVVMRQNPLLKDVTYHHRLSKTDRRLKLPCKNRNSYKPEEDSDAEEIF